MSEPPTKELLDTIHAARCLRVLALRRQALALEALAEAEYRSLDLASGLWDPPPRTEESHA